MGYQETNKTVLITGASGFIGHHLVKYLCPDHKVIAFARRTQKEVGLEPHFNLEWMLVDLMDPVQLKKAFQKASSTHSIDFIFHLAAYYDFGDQVFSQIYEKTNVEATRILLELTKQINVQRFVFTSSLVASKFPVSGDLVYERSIPDANFPYAVTKRQGEKLVEEFSQFFPCTVVRLAAVCSDWCEYEPLYHFLKIWLSDRWDARILPGKGSMAIPYIHVCCVVDIFEKIIMKSSELKKFDTYLASSDSPVSLVELFKLATQQYFGKERNPTFIPVLFAKAGVIWRNIMGKITGNRPFERLWMLDYTDRQFPTDSSYTRETLEWYPKPRHHLKRRLLHLIENLKARPEEWHQKNIDRLHRFAKSRPSLTLAEEMVKMHEPLVEKIYSKIMLSENQELLKFYHSMNADDLKWYINVVYNNLLTSVRHGDRSIMITFARDLSHRRMQEHASLEELCGALCITRDVITHGLYNNPNLLSMKLLVHDYITLAIQLAIDEIKDVYENVPR
ncbi:MAG: NAD(P)-dependent oxidoreductase [Candidatus Marinimicrobia bacterium]|jgi:nucleoside-diphosphate-sugar epimerase|nr:NAD(P)-dependent oxidoreductase [Candidatus Neomarinimicrobiota bacterium]MBT4362608.1 NAD(P)-dependent oxidoreductase [Candidatus Neomarinimicrobiota bacterium]MBT4713461.1 NAD(P)-dependent oxidoreductase [Candidatus Neomarinimicrobiota bacterium]MBT4944631.1 NAD(P)-dependent oxidoreductase [Candidatus Neomarinimicrobiota bacterium]MBT5270693.1 NAD(P)-dependent oxidoreductase [Candidatus Neomarinimicrobiota bacterium]